MFSARTSIKLFFDSIGRLLEHPDGYVIFQYNAGPRKFHPLQTLLTPTPATCAQVIRDAKAAALTYRFFDTEEAAVTCLKQVAWSGALQQALLITGTYHLLTKREGHCNKCNGLLF